jgi:hypothetical protein
MNVHLWDIQIKIDIADITMWHICPNRLERVNGKTRQGQDHLGEDKQGEKGCECVN